MCGSIKAPPGAAMLAPAQTGTLRARAINMPNYIRAPLTC